MTTPYPMTSRNKAVLAALGLTVVILIAALIWSLARPHMATTEPVPNTLASSAEPTFNPSAGDAGDDQASDDQAGDPDQAQEAVWRPVVEHFARDFTNTAGGNQKWCSRLAGDRTPPYVTEAVTAQLCTVDVRNVPHGHYSAYEALKRSAYEVAVRVDYREGWSLVLYLNTDGTDWQVYAYDRYEE